VIGVKVRLECEAQLEPQFAEQQAVPVELFEDGIDQQRLTRLAVGEQVGVR